MKLFRQKIDPACQYCAYASPVTQERVNCSRKKKLMECNEKCYHFQYDPLKRVPSKAKALDFSQYEDCDYSL